MLIRFLAALLLLCGSAFAQVPATITANIDNAPAWQASHTYATPGNEVSNTGGSGVAGTRGYKNISIGSCVSAGSGGPTGTGASIADGTCTWKYQTDIDYTSIIQYNQLGIPTLAVPLPWTTGTAYNKNDTVINLVGGLVYGYVATNAATSGATAPTCTSGTCSDGAVTWQEAQAVASSPILQTTGYITSGTLTVTGSTTGIAANSQQIIVGPGMAYNTMITTGSGSTWATLPSSQTVGSSGSPIPIWVFGSICGSHGGGAVNRMVGNYVGVLWNGAEYVDDGNNIASWPPYPIVGSSGVLATWHNSVGLGSGCGEGMPINVAYAPYTTTLTVAAGESIADLAQSAFALQYAQADGVAIRCSNTTGGTMGQNCMYLGDGSVRLSRIQLKAHDNGIYQAGGLIDQVLVDAPSATGTGIFTDFEGVIANSVIYAGEIGLAAKYRNLFINDTVFGYTGAAVGIYFADHQDNAETGASTLRNTAVFGFTYGCGTVASQPTNGFETAQVASDYNATDVTSGGSQSGTSFSFTSSNLFGSSSALSISCPGTHTLFSTPFTTANFTNVTSGSFDARLVTGSALQGAGLAAGTFTFTADEANGSNVLLNNGETCSPGQSPFYGKPSCPYMGVGVSGTGIPGGTKVTFNGSVIVPFLPTGVTLNANATATQATQSFTGSYDPIQATDLYSNTRSTYDIGAAQLAIIGPVSGGRHLFR